MRVVARATAEHKLRIVDGAQGARLHLRHDRRRRQRRARGQGGVHRRRHGHAPAPTSPRRRPRWSSPTTTTPPSSPPSRKGARSTPTSASSSSSCLSSNAGARAVRARPRRCSAGRRRWRRSRSCGSTSSPTACRRWRSASTGATRSRWRSRRASRAARSCRGASTCRSLVVGAVMAATALSPSTTSCPIRTTPRSPARAGARARDRASPSWRSGRCCTRSTAARERRSLFALGVFTNRALWGAVAHRHHPAGGDHLRAAAAPALQDRAARRPRPRCGCSGMSLVPFVARRAGQARLPPRLTYLL